MATDDVCNSCEDIRRRNIERNKNMMQELGLLLPRVNKHDETHTQRICRRRTKVVDNAMKPRRSKRVACNSKANVKEDQCLVTKRDVLLRESLQCKDKAQKDVLLRGLYEEVRDSTVQKDLTSTMEREEWSKMVVNRMYSNNSSESHIEGDMSMNSDDDESIPKAGRGSPNADGGGQPSESVISIDSSKTMSPTAFGTQFQEVVIRALMKSIVSTEGLSASVISSPQAGPNGGDIVSKGDCLHSSTWNEAVYNRTTAQQSKKPQMTRTSAGEETDSQEEFPIPENESPRYRSVRTRRLNRSRARKAKELTNNRKAVKKVPYVVHIDGTRRAKGIHKHLWQATVRGQCGRLDPSMDNINHHPKHVVDGLWHALEKDWEFEGFFHRAREMFEKSATKFMRNRKMQLKSKSKKTLDAPRPTDVRGTHWTKIVQITKESSKPALSTRSLQTGKEGKQGVPKVLKDRNDQTLEIQGIQQETLSKSPIMHQTSMDPLFVDKENVDARIETLKRELLMLEGSRKACKMSTEERDEPRVVSKGNVSNVSTFSDFDLDVNAIKANVFPQSLQSGVSSSIYVGTSSHGENKEYGLMLSYAAGKRKASPLTESSYTRRWLNYIEDDKEADCGDLVSLFVVNGGRSEEIGKAIVMGLSGTKYARKIIPKGWSLVKVYTYTEAGALEICPMPTGWADAIKYKTVKDAEGRNILWPESQMRL